MKLQLTHEICSQMEPHLTFEQCEILEKTPLQVFSGINLPAASEGTSPEDYQQNTQLINLFVAAKRIEGCSDNTIKYYANTLTKMAESMQKNLCDVTTNDLQKTQKPAVSGRPLGSSMLSFCFFFDEEEKFIK